MPLHAQRALVIDEPANSPDKRRLGLELAGSNTDESVGCVLAMVRDQFAMDAAFVGEFAGIGEIVRWVTGSGSTFGLNPGEALPNLLSGVSQEVRVGDLAISRTSGFGSFLGVPIRFSDGRLYGTLCALGTGMAPSSQRDVNFMTVVAEVIGDRIERDRTRANEIEAARSRILRVLDGRHELTVLLQPIVDLRTGRIAGCEALSRFMFPPDRTPDRWFEEAWSVDLGSELELCALWRALEHLPSVPKGAYISINVSPAVAGSRGLDEAIPDSAAKRIVLELTEHVRVDDYGPLAEALRRLRRRGVRLAIDDTGAGFASLRHVLRLTPEILKLDLSLTKGLDGDPKRWALVESLLRFSDRIGATVVAEGIESRSDLETLRLIGVPYGQGRALHKPVSPPLPSRIELG